MDLLEHQGKAYFARYGIPVATGVVATTVDEAVAGAGRVGWPAVVKAQVHVGGRGKAGGIRVVADEEAARAAASAILGMSIGDHVVRAVLVEPATDIASEAYASFTLDRSARLHLGMLSARGGVDIEQVAAEEPDAIARLHVDPVDGLTEEACAEWVARAGLPEGAAGGVAALLLRLYRCYVEGDADLVEVNPLVLTAGGEVLALDAKVTLDDSAAFRHPEWDGFRGAQVLDERERLAREKGLQYIGLDGSVGIIANGAGLAMSTLDVVHQVGGSPANFLDIGGGASAAVMANALEVINTDEHVRAIFVNVFGGITRGEEVANGIVEALGRVDIAAPLVVRLDGTNAAEGRAILARHASERLLSRATMLDAARTAVELAAGATPGGEG
ncbi:MAG: ADP-forming succinate--CoA ligase subunit beta [Actinomycetota bacterium]